MTGERKAFDIIVIGAGIAGASLAYRLATAGGTARRVLVLETEDQPGYHATGRSAAFYSRTYGNEIIRMITRASQSFYLDPDPGFCEVPLLEPCGALHVARADQLGSLDAYFEETRKLAPSIERHDGGFATARVPILRQDLTRGSIWEPDSQAINVHALLTGFVNGARRQGVEILSRAKVEALSMQDGCWRVEARGETYEAEIVVNAGGAWAGEIGRMAGAQDIGLQPMRRTVSVIDPAKASGFVGDPAGWPLVLDAEEDFYFKPSGGTIWLSPADETPSAPCDAQPDEMDVAIAVDRFEKATTVQIRRLETSWAGLRSFVPDRTPVVGFDGERPGFFWLAGQGGYGIQTAPALSELASALILGRPLSDSFEDFGAQVVRALSPERL